MAKPFDWKSYYIDSFFFGAGIETQLIKKIEKDSIAELAIKDSKLWVSFEKYPEQWIQTPDNLRYPEIGDKLGFETFQHPYSDKVFLAEKNCIDDFFNLLWKEYQNPEIKPYKDILEPLFKAKSDKVENWQYSYNTKIILEKRAELENNLFLAVKNTIKYIVELDPACFNIPTNELNNFVSSITQLNEKSYRFLKTLTEPSNINSKEEFILKLIAAIANILKYNFLQFNH